MKISKILQVGDNVYSASNGQPMKVLKKDSVGFETAEDYFRYDEHSKLYYLTKQGFLYSVDIKTKVARQIFEEIEENSEIYNEYGDYYIDRGIYNVIKNKYTKEGDQK